MLNVQNYRLTPNVSFKANEEKQSVKQNSGLKTGAVYAGIGTLGFAFSSAIIKTLQKNLPEAAAVMPKTLSPFIYVPLFIASALGCGALVDKKINDNADKFTKETQGMDKKEVLKTYDNADITGRENLYYKPAEGKKTGAVLGAIVMPLLTLAYAKGKPVKAVTTLIGSVINGVVGGLVLGSITDILAGKAFAKKADADNVKA